MLKKIFHTSKAESRRLFKADETRFIISVGLKVSGISFCVTAFTYYYLFQLLRLNHAFFESQGFPHFAEGTPFYDYVISEALNNLPTMFLFHIFLFFIGTYVGWLILRPFRVIGCYCEEVIEKPNSIYKIDEFSNYRLLTRFSEFFFEYLRESRTRGEIMSNSIPPQFLRIHRPVLDWIFLLHFGLLLIIIAICSSVFNIENITSIFQSMAELGEKTLPDIRVMNKFFDKQSFILDELIYMTIFFIGVFYTMLGLHLYNKVSGAAFGIFSTMRSFMKGAYYSRVHLLGFSYLRDHTRKLNKYLDYMEKNFGKQKPKG